MKGQTRRNEKNRNSVDAEKRIERVLVFGALFSGCKFIYLTVCFYFKQDFLNSFYR